MSMTDEQIIEALECCASGTGCDTCRRCPFYEDKLCDKDRFALEKHLLDLIKRQQAEIEKLKKVGNKIDSLGLVAALMDQKERLARFKNEWEREVRAEAIREFAERLKKRLDRKHTIYGREYVLRHMRELVKEMTEEKEVK